jgi:hypothetical protein
MEEGGIDDVAVELALIAAEDDTKLVVGLKRAELMNAYITAGLDPVTAATLAEYDEKAIGIIK